MRPSSYHIGVDQDGAVVIEVDVFTGEMREDLATLDGELVRASSRCSDWDWACTIGDAIEIQRVFH